MLKLRINPLVVEDLRNIRDYIAEDNEKYAAKTIEEIYGKFENLQLFPEMGTNLSKRVRFKTDYKYVVWEDYVIIYKVNEGYIEIYRVLNRYQDLTRIFERHTI
jgi:addiction module toxin, relE/stbE family